MIDNTLDKFVQEAVSKYKLADRYALQELIYLTSELLKIPNNPAIRNNLAKAEFIHNYFSKHNVTSEILEISHNGTWYVVRVTQGTTVINADTFNLIAMFHHDTIISTSDQNYELITSQAGKTLGIAHAYLLDDTIQVASAMLEVINSTTNPPKNNNYTLTVLFTDGEEVNTLGSAGIFELLYQKDDLHPISMCIIGEATGNYNPNRMGTIQDILPKVCYANRGKITFSMKTQDKTTQSTFTTFANWLMFFRCVSKAIYIDSFVADAPEKPSLTNTAVSATYGSFSKHGSTAFIEARTNIKVDNEKTAQSIQQALSLSKADLINSKLLTTFDKSVLINLKNFNQQGNTVTLSAGENIHPGRYNPYLRNDFLSALEVIFGVMNEHEKHSLESIVFGNRFKPNTVPQDAELTFNEEIDFNSIANRAQDSSLWNKVIEEFYSSLQYKAAFEIKINDNIPPRNALATTANNWSKAEIVRKHFETQARQVFDNRTLSVQFGVFNAMSDVGPTTYPHIYPKVWLKDGIESVCCIHLGAGNFNLLHHSKETLTVEELICASVMYKDLFRTVIDQT